VKRPRGEGFVLERATGGSGSRGRRGKRLDGWDTLAPNQKLNGGLVALGAFEYDSQQFRDRPFHAASHWSTFIVASVFRRATVRNGGQRAEGKKVEGRDTLATMNVDRWLAA